MSAKITTDLTSGATTAPLSTGTMTITVTVDSIAQVSVWAIPAGAPPMTLPIPAQEGTITLQPNVPQTFHIPATSGTRYDISVQAINSEAIVVAKLINVQTPFPDKLPERRRDVALGYLAPEEPVAARRAAEGDAVPVTGEGRAPTS